MGEKEKLGKLARGGLITLIGLITSALLGFAVRTAVGRLYGPKEYGVYSLAMTVFYFVLALSMLGFPIGLQREVSYFREKRPHLVGTLVSTALVVVFISATAFMIAIELARWDIPRYIGGGAKLAVVLGILMLALPVSAIVNTLIAVTQGFHRVREYVIYGRILPPALFLAVISTVSLLIGRSLELVVVGYVISQAAILAVMWTDLSRKGILPDRLRFSQRLAKELLLFSLPLFLSSMVWLIMTWTDTLMLGHYLGDRVAGIYNAATPLARFIPVFMTAFTTIYNPIATALYAEGKVEEIKGVYTRVTKWSVLMTFPLFALFFLFPRQVVGTVFGSGYIGAGEPLMILSLGFMAQVLAGPAGLTLVAVGQPRQAMAGNVIGALLNVSLNAALIPAYGMKGAAVATAVSYLVASAYKLLVLWREIGCPLGRDYAKVLLLGGPIVAVGARFLHASSLTGALATTGLLSGVFYAAVRLIAVDDEDIGLMKELLGSVRKGKL